VNNKKLYQENTLELFFIIAYNDKIFNVKITLSKLLKKILSDEKSPLYGDLSIHELCNILLNNQKN
jgi:hypothetical protein